jgi:hypothetical protein
MCHEEMQVKFEYSNTGATRLLLKEILLLDFENFLKMSFHFLIDG